MAGESGDKSARETDAVRAHLRQQYQRVFTDEAIERHLEERVGMSAALEALEILRVRRPDAHRVLDVGSGYGSFVLASREAGLDAVGVEPSSFELEWSRNRLSSLGEARPETIFVEGSADALPFPDSVFDAVTMWNVLEHVQDGERAFAEAARVLRPAGSLFVLAPNYAAIRREAHYHVPWPPFLPKMLAARYLRILGRDPAFFVEEVYPCRKLATVRQLHRLGFELREPRMEKLRDASSTERPLRRTVIVWATRLRLLGMLRLSLRAQQLNPLSQAIFFEAVKRT